ncbi:MAG: hypothetical protein R3B68_02730 [Phycisphaerales bacterium]
MNPEPPITPLHIPAATRDVLLVGGTFDPPHAAHAAMALAAADWIDAARDGEASSHCATESRRLCGVTRCDNGQTPDPAPNPTAIILVPAARSPFKPPPLAPDDARVDMLHALAQHITTQHTTHTTPHRCTVWTDELDRAAAAPTPTPSFWIDTHRRAHAALALASARTKTRSPNSTSSSAPTRPSLHRCQRLPAILELARPAIALRPPIADLPTLTRASSSKPRPTGTPTRSPTSPPPTPSPPCSAPSTPPPSARPLADGKAPPANWLPHQSPK